MTPHTITPAVGVVYRCKVKAGLRRSPRVYFLRARHHSKWRRRSVGVKGSTRNGRRGPKCPSVRRLPMLREDTGTPSKGATCAWRAAGEAVGVHFLRYGGVLEDWSVEGVLNLVFV
ncbi:uncharacterized protein TNCV_750681 [Trichonephila clavipes]|nr:uncharacterized protein TNCV_750681 [Trichonephila clavipes]